MSNIADYTEFLNGVVDEIAQISATKQATECFRKHIKAFLKLANKSNANLWFFPDCLYSDEKITSEEFRPPTNSEQLDFSYTLLAIIHDGYKQDYAQRRIYFYWKKAQEFDEADRASKPGLGMPLESFLLKKCGSKENALAWIVWGVYVKNPVSELYAARQQHYRLVIQDALKVVKADIAKLKPIETERKVTLRKGRMVRTGAKRISRWIYVLVVFFAALLIYLYYLGWLGPIKDFIVRILRSK